MSGSGKTLAVLGGLLVAAVGAVAFLTMGPNAPDPAGEAASESAAAPADSAKPSKEASGRSRKAGTSSVVGEVRRSKGKAPVPDQQVELLPERGDPWTAVTDAKGAFHFDQVPHGGPYEVRVTAKGCGTIHLPGIALERGEKRDVGTLWLDPAVKASIRVRSSGDAPLEGAKVEAFAVPTMSGWDWSKMLAQMNQVPVPVATGTSDAQGNVVFPELAAGQWTFTATKLGYARGGKQNVSLRADLETSPVTIYLSVGHPLAGRVLDKSKGPVPGALVMTGSNAWDLSSAPLRRRATSDAEGAYAFDSLDTGETVLSVARPGAPPATVATLRIPLVSKYDIVLPGLATVSGKVTDQEGGVPIEGATVRAPDWGQYGAQTTESVTDAEGRYKLVVAENSNVQPQVEKEGYVQVQSKGMNMGRPMMVTEGETAVRDLQLKRGVKISGDVKGPDGPVAGARITVMSAPSRRGWSQKTGVTDDAGHYEIVGVDSGKSLVRADKEGLFAKNFPDNPWQAIQQAGMGDEFKVDIPETGEAKKDVTLQRGGLIEGRVDGTDGTPLSGVRVQAASGNGYSWGFDSNSYWAGGVVTGPDGTFRLEGVHPGPNVGFNLTKEGYAGTAKNKPVTVSESQPLSGVVLVMAPVAHVTGHVTRAGGDPARDAFVTVSGYSDDNQWQMPQMGNWQSPARVPVRPDGSYETTLGGQTSGKFVIRAMASDMTTGESKPVAIVDGETSYTVDLQLEDGRTLEGRVIQKPGGPAVASADIAITPQRTSNDMDLQMSRMRMEESMRGGGRGYGGTVWAVTDADGRFSVPHLAVGSYRVEANARDYVRGGASVDLSQTGQVTVEIETEKTIEGTVTFAEGGAVEGVWINAQRERSAGGGGAGVRLVDGGGGGVMNVPAMGDFGDNAGTTTGKGGRFRIGGLTSGSYRLNVNAAWDGSVNLKPKTTEPIASGTKDVKIVVETGGTISGRVVDVRKQPISNVWINARPDVREGGKPMDGNAWRGSQVESDGTFTLNGLTESTYTVTVNPQGPVSYRMLEKSGVAIGTKDLELILEEGLSIEGVVVDAQNKPLSGVQFMVTPVQNESAPRAPMTMRGQQAMSDAEGKFQIGGLDPGDYRVQIPNWGGGGPYGGWLIEGGDKVPAGTAGLRLVASKGLTIAGVVTDESGKPLPGVNINAMAPQAQGRNARTRDDGTFEIAGLTPGARYKLLANMKDRVTAKVTDVQAGATDLRLMLPPGLTASGKLLDSQGAAMKRTFLRLMNVTDPDLSSGVNTDDQGKFSVSGLADGTYTASVWVQSPKAENKQVGTIKGGDTNLELRMP